MTISGSAGSEAVEASAIAPNTHRVVCNDCNNQRYLVGSLLCTRRLPHDLEESK